MIDFVDYCKKYNYKKTFYDYQSEWLDEQLNVKNNFNESQIDKNDLKSIKEKEELSKSK